MIVSELMSRIEKSRQMAFGFPDKLRTPKGYKYTINHDIEKHPAALLYGTWSAGYLKHLLLGNQWKDEREKTFIIDILNRNRLENGIFFGSNLRATSYSKSKEYLSLHCYNYAVGAALIINPDYDFQSKFMDFF